MNVSQPGGTVTQTLKAIRAGVQALLVTDTTVAVTFSSAMPSTSYTVHFETSIAVASHLGVMSKTVNGFTMLSLGVAMNVKYKALED